MIVKIRKLRINYFLLALALSTQAKYSQLILQTVKGKSFDNETQSTLASLVIVIVDSNPVLAAIANNNGNFKISNVPVGSYNIK